MIPVFLILQKILDYLKIDVEDAEWDSLKDVLQTDFLQTKVRQLGFEIHAMIGPRNRMPDFDMRADVLQRLYSIGFRRWYVHFNTLGKYTYKGTLRTCCYEMVYVNSGFMRNSNATSELHST